MSGLNIINVQCLPFSDCYKSLFVPGKLMCDYRYIFSVLRIEIFAYKLAQVI